MFIFYSFGERVKIRRIVFMKTYNENFSVPETVLMVLFDSADYINNLGRY